MPLLALQKVLHTAEGTADSTAAESKQQQELQESGMIGINVQESVLVSIGRPRSEPVQCWGIGWNLLGFCWNLLESASISWQLLGVF